MTQVPMFSYDDVTCEWIPRKGLHVFERAGRFVAQVRSNAAWMIGMRNPPTDGWLLPRFATVERSWRRRNLPHALVGWGNNLDGGEQGGQGIKMHPEWTPSTQAELDGTIEGNPICAFHWETGEPLTRDNGLGYAEQYTPLRNDSHAEPPFQLRPFTGTRSGHSQEFWQADDPAHYARTFSAAVAAWEHDRCPVAFLWLQVCAANVLNALPIAPVGDGYGYRQSLATMRQNVRAGPGLAKIGEIRALAHSARSVAEAHKAAPKPAYADWLRMFIEVVGLAQAPSGVFADGWKEEGCQQGLPWVEHGSAYRVLDDDEGECASWEDCFLIVALNEARKALGDIRSTRAVKSIVAKYMRIYQTCPLVPGEYGGIGLPKYLVTSRARVLHPDITEGTDGGINEYVGDSLQAAMELGVAIQ